MLITVKVFSASLHERIPQISHHQRFEIYVKEKAKDGQGVYFSVRNIPFFCPRFNRRLLFFDLRGFF